MKRIIVASLILILTIPCLNSAYATTVTGSVNPSGLERVLSEKGEEIEWEEDTEHLILKKGSEGEEVRIIQQKLIDIGIAKGKANGKFGKGTEAAVKKFQKTVGLESTGIVDSATYDALINYEGDIRKNSNNEQSEDDKENNDEARTASSAQESEIAITYEDIEDDYPTHFLAINVTLPTGEKGRCYSDYYDFSQEISSYADTHEEYKYKKVPIEYQPGKETIIQESELLYRGEVHYILANDQDVTKTYSFKMSELFPEIYIDYDLIRAKQCWKKYTSLTTLGGKVKVTLAGTYTAERYPEYHYYVFKVTNGTRNTKVFAMMDSDFKIAIAEYDGMEFYKHSIDGVGPLDVLRLNDKGKKITLLNEIDGSYNTGWISDYIEDAEEYSSLDFVEFYK